MYCQTDHVPPSMRPMLATKGDAVPTGDDWRHEVKWDGVRMLADVHDGSATARLTTRNGNDATIAWPDVHVAPMDGRDVLVDGEIIGINDAGVPDFSVIQERMHVRSAGSAARLATAVPVTYMVFDVMRLDGRDHLLILHGAELLIKKRPAFLFDDLGRDPHGGPPNLSRDATIRNQRRKLIHRLVVLSARRQRAGQFQSARALFRRYRQ